jgi:hypothetical protein
MSLEFILHGKSCTIWMSEEVGGKSEAMYDGELAICKN